MGAFSYRALNEAGKSVKGVMEGDSERQVRSLLRAKKLKPLEVLSVNGKTDTAASGGFSLLPKPRARLNTRDLSLVTRQLASLVKSGLPLDEALHATARQNTKQHVKQILLQVRTKVLEGFSLAQAMGELPGAFNEMYRALVRAGESSGYLGPVLGRLADYTQNGQAMQQRIKLAMIYPIVLFIVSISVIVLLMAFVVPDLVKIFDQNKRQLPLLTEMLIATSDFVINWGIYVFFALVAAVIGLRRLLKIDAYQLRWHRMQLRLPVIGNLVRQVNSARFAATLSLLSSSGVPLLQALTIAGQVMSNRLLQASCEQVTNAVREGSSLYRAMDNAGTFPPLLVQLVASGETNGTLPQQLDNAAKDQERELEGVLGMTMGLLEPLTIVFMGVSVCLIVLAILMPILDLNKLV